MEAKVTFDDLRDGLSVDDALEAFKDGICKPDRYWIPRDSVPSLLDRLRGLLHSPLTDDDAQVLRQVTLKQTKLDIALRWWTEHRDLAWDDFLALLDQEEAAQARALAAAEEEREQRQRREDYWEWKHGSSTRTLPDGRKVVHEVLPEVMPQPPATLTGETLDRWRWMWEAEYRVRPATEAMQEYGGHPCPLCGAPASELRWAHVRYNDMFVLSGTEWIGWMTFCDKCQVRVEGFVESSGIA